MTKPIGVMFHEPDRASTPLTPERMATRCTSFTAAVEVNASHVADMSHAQASAKPIEEIAAADTSACRNGDDEVTL